MTGGSFFERTGCGTVDLISGGFPCQPFSFAGKRRGSGDDRYLWPEMLRVIKELRPRWVIGENVAGIVNMALDTVLSDLESIGYTTGAFIIPACAVDAPHRRDRVCIVGWKGEQSDLFYSNPTGTEYSNFTKGPKREREQPRADGLCETIPHSNSFNGRTRRAEREGQSRETEPTYGGFNVPDPNDRRGPMRRQRELSAVEEAGSGGGDHGGGAPEHGAGERRAAKPGLGGMADGLPHWLDEPLDVPRIARGVKDRVNRLKCLGNAVVPQQFYPVFRAIAEIERGGSCGNE